MATTNYPQPTHPHQFGQVQQVQQFQQGPPAPHVQPAPQPAPQATRPPPPAQTQSRKSRSFSFRSDKSHGSNNNSNKIDLHETHLEKEAKRLHTHADPTMAMSEQQPSEVAANVKSSLASLRAMQHKDVYGNIIAEPDRSNPTRSRWERPLDTIRSFEAAIDGNYSSRKSFIRPDSEAWNSRRTSYYGPNDRAPGRFSHDSFYGNRPPSMIYSSRNDGSQNDLRQPASWSRDSHYDQQGYGGQRRIPRTNSDVQNYPGYRQQNPNEYAIPSNHRSYETVASASGSGSSAEPAGYQTDPTSSENSSVDRVQAVPRRQPEPVNDYGIGFSQDSEYQAPAFTVGVKKSPMMNGGGTGNQTMTGYQPPNGAISYGNSAPPAPPQKDRILRKPTNSQATQQPQERPAAPEKRKSWFSRRFSKHG
ncbi:meiotically up-regulated gene 9 protein [Naviculisporaceae sp. PSN 640]